MWFMTRFYTAPEAEKMGLINTVVPVKLISKPCSVVTDSQDKSRYLLVMFCSFTETCFLFQLRDLEKETVKWCREILRNSPTAIRVLKAALNAVDDGHAGLQVPSSTNLLSLFPFLKELNLIVKLI